MTLVLQAEMQTLASTVSDQALQVAQMREEAAQQMSKAQQIADDGSRAMEAAARAHAEVEQQTADCLRLNKKFDSEMTDIKRKHAAADAAVAEAKKMLESNAAAQALINRRLAESEEHSQWLLEQRNALSATVKTPSVYSNPAFAVFSKAVRPAVSSAHTAFPVHHVSGSSSNLSASTPAQGRFSSGGMGDNGSDMLQRTKEIIREQVRASAVRAAARIPSRESSTGSVPQPIAAWQSHGRCCRRRGRVVQINAGIYEAVLYSHGY